MTVTVHHEYWGKSELWSGVALNLGYCLDYCIGIGGEAEGQIQGLL